MFDFDELFHKYVSQHDELHEEEDVDVLSEEQSLIVESFKKFYDTLTESQKSQIVKILIGNGVLDKKGDKLVPGKNKAGATKALKKAGIDPKDVSK